MSDAPDEAELADLLDQASARRARGRPATAVDLPTPVPLRDELDSLIAVAESLDRAADDWREAAAVADTPNPTADPDHPTGTLPEAASASAPAAGQVGRYRLVRRVGAGGMGEVFEATDPELGRRVALKLPFLGPGGEVVRQRFVREARSAAGVRHPNVCPVYDAGEDGGRPFVVMAFVDGETLADRLRRGRFADPREAVALAAAVADGLAAVHAAGIVHRDLKPGNILLDAAGTPLLTDFGLARPTAPADPLTADGSTPGTPAYMPPEQADPSLGPTTPQSDLYSLGVTMYHMLTGRVPFPGNAFQQLARLAGGDPVPPPSAAWPGLDPRLDAIVLKATARTVGDRYATAADMAADLNRWLAAAPARPARRRWVVAAAVAAAVLVGGLGLWAATRPREDAARLNPVDPPQENPGEKKEPPTQKADPPRVNLPPMSPAALVPAPGMIPGLASWNLECDGRQDAPEGARFLGANRLRLQFDGTMRERDIDLVTGAGVEPKFPGQVGAATADRGRWLMIEPKVERQWGVYDTDGKLGRALRELPQSVRCAFSPDGKLVAATTKSPDGAPPTLSVWSAATGDLVWRDEVAPPSGRRMAAPVWVDGGRGVGCVAHTAAGPELVVRSAADGKPLARYPVAHHTGDPAACAVSPDGAAVAVVGHDAKGHTLTVWRLDPKKELLRFSAGKPEAPVPAFHLDLPFASWSADGKRLSFAANDFAVRVWDAATGKLLRTVEVRPAAGENLLTADLSADGKTLAVRQRRLVRFVDVDDGRQRGVMVFFDGGQWLAVSPDGHYKASSKEAGARVVFTAKEAGKEEVKEYTPAEFAAKFGWKNDPSKVKLFGD